MREILFRGKCKTDNEWLYGFPYVTRKNAVKINWYCSEFGSMRTDEVDPETVGQYTGLTDKNGARIFEGDIVRATIERAERCQSPRIENGVIGYDCIGMIGLILYKDKNGENVWSDFFNELSLSGLIEDYYFEIIGNIHDNPDILKGGGDNG